MNRSLKQKLAARAAVVVVLVGGAVAAVTATGQGPSYTPVAARGSAHRVVSADLAAAASYLGTSGTQLQSDLASSKTLAEVADATSGKSAAGLIAALVATKKQKLDLAAASLTKRVTAAVNRSGGPGSRTRPVLDVPAGAHCSRLATDSASSPRATWACLPLSFRAI